MLEAEPLPVKASLPTSEQERANPVRAWLALIWLSLYRQARMRQMVWIALGLLIFSIVLVSIFSAAEVWTMKRPVGAPPARPEDAAFINFSHIVVFAIFLSFLLPLWTLGFATDALGGERENNTLIWLLTRPLPRPAIYLAKFFALLPWSLSFNLGGFALLCLAGGQPGRLALQLYWPAVLWSSLALSSLFFLLGAWSRRPAVLALVYSFFLETIFGNMPGYLKRISISFYAQCMMFEEARSYGVEPDKPSIFLPIDGPTALAVLIGLTMGLLVLGMVLFSRTEYHEVS